MFKSATPDDRFANNRNQTQDVSSHGAELPGEKKDNNSWQTVHFPGTVPIEQISGVTPNVQINAMDSSSIQSVGSTFELSASNPSTVEQAISQRETELLNLVRDLNECNDVLLTKVAQLEESLERSQAALQAEIDRAGGDRIADRDIVQLVTELDQSNQALQHHQMLNQTLQTELTAFQERAKQVESEHKALLRQHTEQSQELLQANTDCRDLRARLQRQQRYTLQFKAALEKCLSMSTESQNSSVPAIDPLGVAIPKADEIRPWESALGHTRLDTHLASMIRGLNSDTDAEVTVATIENEAEDQLWHDLARVVGPDESVSEVEVQSTASEVQSTGTAASNVEESPQFTEPSPWIDKSSDSSAQNNELEEDRQVPSQLSPEANEILARVQAAKSTSMADTYLPVMSAQGSPSPLVKPLRPQKRISSLSAIDLPNFPRLKKQPPTAKA